MAAIKEKVLPRTDSGNDPNDNLGDPDYLGNAQPIDDERVRRERLTGAQLELDQFVAHMPDHRYVFMPTGDLWPSTSVNARLPEVEVTGGKKISPSAWLDAHRPVEQMIWAPGESQIVRGRLLHEGGWMASPACSAFNLYRPPTIRGGNANDATRWIEHVQRVYPNAADHIIAWCAQRVQAPATKINHALVLGGAQGVGKDTLLEPVKHAVGPWNFKEVSPPALLGRFNSFVKSVVLRVSEARDLGELDRFAFYDHMKVYTAAPPDVLRCDEKNIREHPVANITGVVITTNHKSDGIYLPADDRRHFVAWSDAVKEDFSEAYWRGLWAWYANGGFEHVAAYLAGLDISAFDPKVPPPKTEAFWHIVDAARSPEESELAEILESMGRPPATTLDAIISRAELHHKDLAAWLRERRNRRQVPHRLESCGYETVRNPAAKRDGLWKVGGRGVAIYCRRELNLRDRLSAAAALVSGARGW